MITPDNFWKTDLDVIESVFLKDGQKITDLYFNQEYLGAEFQKCLNENMYNLYES